MDIVHLKGDRKYWVVRPGISAEFSAHFHQNSIIALGHMDAVQFSGGGLVTPEDVDIISDRLYAINANKMGEEKESKAQMTKRTSQLRSFICDIKVGDVVLSPKKETVLIGRVISKPFLEKEDVNALGLNSEILSKKLNYNLRRKVVWDTHESKKSLPYMIRESLGASQSIFSLDSHQTLLEHWLYSIYIDEQGLHFSTKIDQGSNISQFHITEFQRTIQKLELIADLILDNRLSTDDENFLENIEKLYIQYGMENRFSLTTKLVVTSPGNIWSSLPSVNIEKLLITAMLLQSLNGNALATNVTKDDISDINVQKLQETSEILLTAGNFNDFKSNIDAKLDKRRINKIKTEESEIKIDNNLKFPDIDDKGKSGK